MSRHPLQYTLLISSAIFLASCGQSTENGVSLTDLFGSPADASAGEHARQVEIASCMKRQGFVYEIPAAPTGQPPDDPIIGALDPGQVNPNEERIASLSPVQRSAYFLALVGKDGTGGCQGTAQAKSYGPRDELNKKLGDLFKRVATDPRIRTIDQKWSTCMKKYGYEVARPSDIVPGLLMPEFVKLKSPAGNGQVIDPAAEERFKEYKVQISTHNKKCNNDADERTRSLVLGEYMKRFQAENSDLVKSVKEDK